MRYVHSWQLIDKGTNIIILNACVLITSSLQGTFFPECTILSSAIGQYWKTKFKIEDLYVQATNFGRELTKGDKFLYCK